MKYDKKMTFKEINDLADRQCKRCHGLGVRSSDGKTAIASDEILESGSILGGDGKPVSKGRVYMTCTCVRKNLTMKRRQAANRGN